MRKKAGILHVYLNPSKIPRVPHSRLEIVIASPLYAKASGGGRDDISRGFPTGKEPEWEQKFEIVIVGDEEGLYRLWMAAGEAMVSRAGKGSFESQTAAGLAYETLLLRVEGLKGSSQSTVRSPQ